MISPLQKEIFFTVAYYDAMKYSLTTFELWKQLLMQEAIKKEVTFQDLLEALESGWLKKRMISEKGRWYLKEVRTGKYQGTFSQKISVAKIKRMKRWLTFFEGLPYLRGVFVTGTLAMKNSKRESDWDVLIVLARNRIWVGRLFLTLFLEFFGKRRHGKRTKDCFCLNHFLAEQALIFEERNEFSANEVVFSIPLLGKSIHNKFIQLNEHWIQFYKPNFKKDKLESNLSHEISRHKKMIRKFLEYILELFWLGELLNKISKKIMIKKINENPKTYLKTADIRYGDMSLVFLPDPQREKIYKAAQRKLTKAIE